MAIQNYEKRLGKWRFSRDHPCLCAFPAWLFDLKHRLNVMHQQSRTRHRSPPARLRVTGTPPRETATHAAQPHCKVVNAISVGSLHTHHAKQPAKVPVGYSDLVSCPPGQTAALPLLLPGPGVQHSGREESSCSLIPLSRH